MGTPGLSHRTPPVLAGGTADGDEVIYYRDIKFTGADAFEASLAEWVSRYMMKSRVAVLMQDASGLRDVIEYLKNAGPTMNLEGTRRIYAHLFFGRTADGSWWVRGIGFSLIDTRDNINAVKRKQLREHLEDVAAERAARKPIPAWKLYFVPPQGCGDFAADVKAGDQIVQKLIDSAHAKAKEFEPMLKNPIGPNMDSDGDILKESVKAFVSAYIPNWDTSKYVTAFMTGETIGEDAVNKPDKIALAGQALDLALTIATEGDPLAGFGSVILGSFIEIGIANDAGRVAKIRGRLYVFYIAGLLSKAINYPRQKAKNKAEKTMLELGVSDAAALTPCGRYQLQLSLLHYVATHNVTSSWSFQNYIDKGWIFPTHYQLYWDPDTLAGALAWQLAKLKYLIK